MRWPLLRRRSGPSCSGARLTKSGLNPSRRTQITVVCITSASDLRSTNEYRTADLSASASVEIVSIAVHIGGFRGLVAD